jgi:hypothetical protein
MGVLNESDENLHESGRERARTVHEIGDSINQENHYEQSRERSKTFENHATRTLLGQNQYALGKHGETSNAMQREQYELPTHLSSESPHEQNQHESHLTVQASMKMAHNANPQPKLQRSMSERLPARQRKRLNGRRDISEELLALNLSRVPKNGYYYDLNDRRDFQNNNLSTISEPQSPNEDLGYGGEIPNDFDDYGRSSVQDYYASGSKTLPRNRNRREECYPAWKEGEREEFVCGRPQYEQNRSNVSDLNRSQFYDDAELYRRAQARNSRGARRQTIEICPTPTGEDGYRATGDWNHTYSNNEEVQNYVRQGVPPRRMPPENNRFNSRDFEENLVNNNVTVKRKDSACSDTAVASCHRRMMQKQIREDYMDLYNRDYYYEQGYTRDLPSYEETLFQRQRLSSDSRRPAPRQVSQV